MSDESPLFLPSVFIGCSSPALPLARSIKAALGTAVRAYVWDEDEVKRNADSSFTPGAVMANLFQKARLFDFALMILRPDDIRAGTDEQNQPITVDVPRDNVIFELGLFMGAIGGRNALAVVSDSAGSLQLPSDMFGFDRLNLAGEDEASVQAAAPDILLKIMTSYESIGLSLLPSTGLATGYFNNFVRPVCRYLEGGRVTIDEKDIDVSNGGYLFDIVIPRTLKITGQEALANYRQRHGDALVARSVKLAARPYPFYVHVAPDDGRLHIVDYVTPLSASVAAIDLVLETELTLDTAEDPGGPERLQLAKDLMEEREIANFRRTIQKLLDREVAMAEDEASRNFPRRVRIVTDAA